jgi:hypothetical protein
MATLAGVNQEWKFSRTATRLLFTTRRIDMGYTWEVSAYRQDGRGGYRYDQSYTGESLLAAILNMWKCKRDGAGCVKLEWR